VSKIKVLVNAAVVVSLDAEAGAAMTVLDCTRKISCAVAKSSEISGPDAAGNFFFVAANCS
jgi:phosphoribosylformylglycinamidine (FGAM) synthase-like enzyme